MHADDHEDDADGVDVEAGDLGVHGPGEDCADRDEQDAEADSHVSSFPLFAGRPVRPACRVPAPRWRKRQRASIAPSTASRDSPTTARLGEADDLDRAGDGSRGLEDDADPVLADAGALLKRTCSAALSMKTTRFRSSTRTERLRSGDELLDPLLELAGIREVELAAIPTCSTLGISVSCGSSSKGGMAAQGYGTPRACRGARKRFEPSLGGGTPETMGDAGSRGVVRLPHRRGARARRMQGRARVARRGGPPHVAEGSQDRLDGAIDGDAPVRHRGPLRTCRFSTRRCSAFSSRAEALRCHGRAVATRCSLTGEVRRIFELTLLDRVFDLDASRDAGAGRDSHLSS